MKSDQIRRVSDNHRLKKAYDDIINEPTYDDSIRKMEKDEWNFDDCRNFR